MKVLALVVCMIRDRTILTIGVIMQSRSLRHLRVVAVLTIVASLITPTLAINTVNSQNRAERTVTLTIAVVASGGKAIPDARVNVWISDLFVVPPRAPDYQLTTNQDGVATREVSINGNVRIHLQVERSGFFDKADQIILEGKAPAVISRTITLSPRAERNVALAITVVANGGKAIPNAKVNIWNVGAGPRSDGLDRVPDYQLNTNQEGVVAVSVPTSYNYFDGSKQILSLRLQAVKTDFITKTDQINLTGDIPNELTRTIIMAPTEPRAERNVTLAITVVANGGKAIPNARVNIWNVGTGPRSDEILGLDRVPDYQLNTNQEGVVAVSVPTSYNYFDGSKQILSLRLQAVKTDFITKTDQINLTGNIPNELTRTIIMAPTVTEPPDSEQMNLVIRVVRANDPNSPVEGARVEVFINTTTALLMNKRREYSGQTNSEGIANVKVMPYTDFEVKVSRNGFERSTVVTLPADQQRKLPKEAGPFTITLDEYGGSEVTFVVRDEETGLPLPEAKIVVDAGFDPNVTLPANRWGLTTDADGRAKVSIPGGIGKYSISISKQFYEPRQDEQALRAGEGARELPYTLKPTGEREDASQDIVRVTVLAGDRTLGGKPMPIIGASVWIGEKGLSTDLIGGTQKGRKPWFKETVSTDKSGQVTLRGYFIDDAVQVKATAKGYKSQTQMVSISKDRSNVKSRGGIGRATFTLELGEDEQAEDTPITLIVEVRDSFDNKPVKGAAVGFLELNGSLLIGGYTDEKGEQDFQSGEISNKPVTDLRQGIKLDIRSNGYKELKGVLVSADLLKPSFEPRKFSVTLEREWTELRAAVAVLEGRVTAWNNDVRLVSEKTASVNRLVKETAAAEAQAIKLAEGLGPGIVADDIPGGKLSSATLCRKAGELKQSIQQYETEALSKERSVKQLLDNAGGVAANCKSAEQAQMVKRDYNAAVKLSGEIGALVNKARTANEQLTRLSSELKGRATTSEQESKLAELVKLSLAADQAAINAEVDTRRAEALSKGLSGRHAALTGELATLRTTYGINKSGTGLPADLKQSLDNMESLVGSRNNDVMSGPNPNAPELVKASAEKIRGIKTDAERALNVLKNSAAQCDVAPMDQSFERMGNAIVSATVELSAAAHLNTRADECALRGVCQPLMADVRTLFEQDELEAAETRISAARAQSCDVSNAEKELEYWRTVRRTANLVAASLESCRFQEALNIGQRVPQGIKNRPLVGDALEVARRGVEAQQRITQLRGSARREVARTNQAAAAQPYIAQAEQAAEGFPCLVEEFGKFRDEYKVTALINKPPQLETIPDEADRPVETAEAKPKMRPASPKTKPAPQLEELPDNAERPIATTGVGGTRPTGTTRPRPAGTNRTGAGTGTKRQPEVEPIPDVEDTKTQSAGDASTRRTTPVAPNNPTDNSTSKKPTAGGVSGVQWVLDSATVRPTPPPPGWRYSTESSSAELSYENGDKASYQWTLPQQIDLSGFAMSINVRTQPSPSSRMSSVISIAGGGMASDTPTDQQGAYARSAEQPGVGTSDQKTITFKPGPSAEELQLTVALHWGGVVFRYRYRRAK